MHHSKEYLADLIWLRHQRRPVDVWMQGLLVVAQFADHTTAVHRIETLEAGDYFPGARESEQERYDLEQRS